MSLSEYRRLALMSLWTGMIATLGIVFVFIPNVELVILAAFLGGTALGPRHGFIVAILGEAIFSALNPIGSGLGFPVLFVFQVFSVGFAGLLGGFASGMINNWESSVRLSVMLGALGLIITVFYDFMTTLSFLLTAGISETSLLGTISTGMLFFVVHMISNTIIFSLFGPALISLINRQLLMHRLILE
ncbi:hypothetical protein HQ531_12230 [bacterium]|nr:hypothetical protein [bacterium]